MIALAAVVGALAGAAATAGLLRDDAAAPIAAATNQALQGSVETARQRSSPRSRPGSAQRSAAPMPNSASSPSASTAPKRRRPSRRPRSPRSPRASIGLERRDARSARPPEITGSVTAAKQQSKPPLAEGWRLRDFYAGRAVVESRSGRLFEVGPGSNLPGLGRVETIKREDGQVVVVTRNGIIAASLEPRRLPLLLSLLTRILPT